jgi:hypothetical protein
MFHMISDDWHEGSSHKGSSGSVPGRILGQIPTKGTWCCNMLQLNSVIAWVVCWVCWFLV